MSEHASMTSRKHPVGSKRLGVRNGRKCCIGEVVETYYTLNNNLGCAHRNPAYKLLCEDGKVRVYQMLYKLDDRRAQRYLKGGKQ